LIVEAADTILQPLPPLATPIVISPPPEAVSPPTVCTRLTAWPSLAASLESLASASDAVELSLNNALLRSTHARAASTALSAAMVAPSEPPRSTSEDGVPKSFQATCDASCRASAICAFVGLIVPFTSMSGKALDVSIGSVAATAAAPGTTRHATRTARTTWRACISPLPGQEFSTGASRSSNR
jgi:hypothetical protein